MKNSPTAWSRTTGCTRNASCNHDTSRTPNTWRARSARSARSGVGTAGSKNGIAIFLVVMVGALVGVFVAIVVYHQSTVRQQTATHLEGVQAQILARSAQQHFLLKFGLLPTELYDATSYSAGKNPFFDFSIDITAVNGNTFSSPYSLTAGPMFFTGSADRTAVTVVNNKARVDRSAEGNNIYLNSSAGFTTPADDNRLTMRLLLDHYILDIATNYPDATDENASIVVVSSQPHRELARMGRPDRAEGTAFNGATNQPLRAWRDPFIGSYMVKEINLLGIGGADTGKKYQADSVLVTTEAIVRLGGQISLVTQKNGSPLEIRPPRQVKRKLTTTGDGWVQLAETLESWEDYQARIGMTASGKRTEIVTGAYFVSRGQE